MDSTKWIMYCAQNIFYNMNTSIGEGEAYSTFNKLINNDNSQHISHKVQPI